MRLPVCLLLVLSAAVGIRLLKPVRNHLREDRFCEICNLNFKRVSEYNIHINGKRHLDASAKNVPSDVMAEYATNASRWAEGLGDLSRVVPLYKKEELGLLNMKMRSTCMDPSVMLRDLNPDQKARVWRYCRDVMGISYYNEVATIIYDIDCEDGHVRVKELFESLEAYKVIAAFVVAANKTRPVDSIFELASGHSLVSLLLAYRFQSLPVHAYDLQRRRSLEIYLAAFERHGFKKDPSRAGGVLANFQFHEADLREAKQGVSRGSVVVALHACNELNAAAIDMAVGAGAAYCVMPCCLRKGLYLNSNAQVFVESDQARFALLCGALASHYRAQSIVSIDERITNRNLIICGGVDGAEQEVSKMKFH